MWILVLGIVCAVFLRRGAKPQRLLQKSANDVVSNSLLLTPLPRVWLIAGLVGLLASFYFQWRVPQPTATDISKFVSSDSNNQEQLVIVRGEVASNPRLTRSQRGQFWLQVSQLDEVRNQKDTKETQKGASGKLYVTVPILKATGLHPGQEIAVTGVLYKPKAASNPGAFDFKKYLEREGTFAGLMGRQINILDEEEQWGWWQIRERIVRSQVMGLDIPEGPLSVQWCWVAKLLIYPTISAIYLYKQD